MYLLPGGREICIIMFYIFGGLVNLGVTVVANVQFTVYCTKLLLIFIHHHHRIYGIKNIQRIQPTQSLRESGNQERDTT